MGQEPEQLRAEIAQTRDELDQDLSNLTEKVSPSKVVERRVDATKAAVFGAKDKVMGAAGSATDHASGGGVAVKEKATGNPLAAGLIAFGVGWLVSNLLPASQAEAHAAGRVKDAVGEPVKQELTAAAKEVKDEVLPAAQESLASVKDTANEAVGTVKEQATDAAGTVKDQATDSAQTVKGQAQDAKDDVQGAVPGSGPAGGPASGPAGGLGGGLGSGPGTGPGTGPANGRPPGAV